MSTRLSQKGFTLIELAIVIVLIAILAAIATSRLISTPNTAELTVIKEFRQNLISTTMMYTAQNRVYPEGFDDFVDTNVPLGANKTISTKTFGPNAETSPCTVSATEINCNGTFNHYNNITYTWNNRDISISGI